MLPSLPASQCPIISPLAPTHSMALTGPSEEVEPAYSCWDISSQNMRPCKNELQKEYCVKIKLIALVWQWVTLISWCQTNRLGHSYLVMHNVEGKTHKLLEILKIASRKYTLFRQFLMKYFQITWVDIHISLNKNYNTPILHTCLTSCWSCLCSIPGYLVDPLWFWVLRVKNQKTQPSSWVHRKLKFLEKMDFSPHFWQSWLYENVTEHINFV